MKYRSQILAEKEEFNKFLKSNLKGFTYHELKSMDTLFFYKLEWIIVE